METCPGPGCFWTPRWTADRILQNGMETEERSQYTVERIEDGRPDTSERDGNSLPRINIPRWSWTADRILQNGMETSIHTGDIFYKCGRQTGYFRTGWKHRNVSPCLLYHEDGRPDTSERDGNPHKPYDNGLCVRTADRILQNGMETNDLSCHLLPSPSDGRPDTSERDGNNGLTMHKG